MEASHENNWRERGRLNTISHSSLWNHDYPGRADDFPRTSPMEGGTWRHISRSPQLSDVITNLNYSSEYSVPNYSPVRFSPLLTVTHIYFSNLLIEKRPLHGEWRRLPLNVIYKRLRSSLWSLVKYVPRCSKIFCSYTHEIYSWDLSYRETQLLIKCYININFEFFELIKIPHL